MPVPAHGPQPSFTRHEVDAWLLAAHVRRAALYLQAVGPGNTAQRDAAVTGMSELLEEAFEEVRVASEAAREWSQGVRGESAALRAYSSQLIERGHRLMEGMAQWASPTPKEGQHAESQRRERCQGGPRDGAS